MNIKNILFILFVSVMFSGCVSININHNINSDGSSDLNTVIDYSNLIKSKKEEINNNPCEYFFTETGNYKCRNLGNDKFEIDLEIKKEDIESFDISGNFLNKEYSFDVKDLANVFQKIPSKYKNSIHFDNLKNFKQMGITVNYNVNMPGKIYENGIIVLNSDGGKMELSSIKADDDTIIKSKQKSNLIFIIPAILLLGGLVFLFSFMHNKKTVKNNIVSNRNFENVIEAAKPSLSSQEIQCRDYILQYKNNYSRDSIKQVLITTGISETELENYLDKYY